MAESPSSAQRRQRLVLGVENQDPLRSLGAGNLEFGGWREPLHVDLELPGQPRGLRSARDGFAHPQLAAQRRVQFSRHDSGRHTLLWDIQQFRGPGPQYAIDLRIYDLHRRAVPRRLRVPIVERDPDAAIDPAPIIQRTRRPVVYPGINYDLVSLATGARGRVVDADGVPMRWSRIELRRPAPGDDGEIVARAHGDDRGEFLLVLPPGVVLSPENITAQDLTFELWAHARPASTPAAGDDDPLYDLPLETLAAPGSLVDPVADGHQLPSGYTLAGVQEVVFALGRMQSGPAVEVSVA